MIVSDSVKYYVLKERRHLLNYGVNKYTRNPNYLGETLLYFAYANLVNMWQAWLILFVVFMLIFPNNMLRKDKSLARKDGWKEYSQQSWLFIPKVNGSAIQSYIFYGVFGVLSFAIFSNGGIEATIRMFQKKTPQ